MVLNEKKFISGRYPNLGPEHLLARNIKLYDCVPRELWALPDGTEVTLNEDHHVLFAGKDSFPLDSPLTMEEADLQLARTLDNFDRELEKFIDNTMEYARKEKQLILGLRDLPSLETSIWGRPVVVVVRGRDYKKDLGAIISYIKEARPVLIGVDGGADALLEYDLKPHIILGDMDSVSDRALLGKCERVVHAYTDGRVPGKERVEKLGVKYTVFAAPGTSEDAALLLAARGRINREHILEGRPGMGSTFDPVEGKLDAGALISYIRRLTQLGSSALQRNDAHSGLCVP